MPPEDNQNNNASNFSPLKVDIDPVFKGAPTTQGSENSVASSAYNVLSNQQYVPNETPQKSVNVLNKINPKPSIRTYKDDIQSAIQASHLSSINIAMAENEKMHSKIASDVAAEEKSDSKNSKSKTIFTVSILIIVLGIFALAAAYLLNNQSSTVVVQTQILPSLITTEYKDELNINSVVQNRFVSALSSKINDIQIPVNNIYNVYITTGTSSAKRLITASDFVTITDLNMPDIIKRTLTTDFMVGMYSFGNGNLPFVIFKTSSFDNTYAGMIEWETYLQKDFTQLFRLNGANGGGDIASALTPTVTQKFVDGVVVNQDVRLLRDNTGRTILLYAIFNKDTIIITVNEDAFKEIVDRLNKEKSLQR